VYDSKLLASLRRIVFPFDCSGIDLGGGLVYIIRREVCLQSEGMEAESQIGWNSDRHKRRPFPRLPGINEGSQKERHWQPPLRFANKRMTHQFLIASYRKDFPWLVPNLRSLEKFGKNFLPPVVVVPGAEEKECRKQLHGLRCEIKVKNGPGFGRAQIVMMQGDIFCPGADYVYLSGSDCMAIRPFDHTEYWLDNKPLLLWNTWDHLAKCNAPCMFWRAGVEKALGGTSVGEFMRRLPICYPRALYREVRGHIANLHGNFERYVLHNVNTVKNFSESDVMGEFAYRHMKHLYNFVCLDDRTYEGATAITQFWSHGGMDKPSDRHEGRTPRTVIQEILG
jgi:hypothetical protein